MPLTFFVITAHICTKMMQFEHDNFLLPFVKFSTSPYSLYNGTCHFKNTQHSTRYNSTKHSTLPLPGKWQHTHLSAVIVHNARPIDRAHFAQPMSHNKIYTSPSLVHVCNNRPADSSCIVSYIGRQYARTVPNVDIVGSSKGHTSHLAPRGILQIRLYAKLQ